MKLTQFLVVALAISASSLCANAQKATAPVKAGEQAKNSESTQEDIGDIHSATETEGGHFRSAIQGGAEWVSNARLQGNHSSGDVLWIPTAEIGYNVPIGKKFSLDLMARSESVFYSDYVENSFYGFTGAATLDYRNTLESPRFYTSVEPYWYQSIDTGDKVGAAVGFVAGVDQAIPLRRGLSLFYWGVRYANYQASPDNDDRHQYRLVLSLSHQFRPALYGQVFYTYQYSDYYNNGARYDSRHAVGASMTYQFTEHLFGSFTTGFVDNDSSHPLANYQNATAGVAVTWQF